MKIAPVISQAITCVVVASLFGCQQSRHASSKELLPKSVQRQPVALFPWSCPTYAGGDGTGLGKAVRLDGIFVHLMARRAKEEWIRCHYPDCVIREVRKRIIGQSVIEVVSLQRPSGEITPVYFDVTRVVTKPGVGAWFFLGTNDLQCAGMIGEEYLRNTGTDPWQQCVGTSSGTLIYQIDDEVGNGLLATGALMHGKKHGPWRYERPIEGVICVKYDLGTKMSEDRMVD